MRTLYVNVYQVERCYGGAEEGGWWYDSYTPLESETAECSCNLPVSEWPVQNDRGDFVGWHAELDTWSGRHDSSCNVLLKDKELQLKWSGFEDEWYSQNSNDESEPYRGESFTSGKIRVDIELNIGVYKPERTPMYS